MTLAKTNQERFISACEKVGEAEVRQRFNAGRYDGRKIEWAAEWLELMQDSKSDATRAAESSRLTPPSKFGALPRLALAATFAGIMVVGGLALFAS